MGAHCAPAGCCWLLAMARRWRDGVHFRASFFVEDCGWMDLYYETRSHPVPALLRGREGNRRVGGGEEETQAYLDIIILTNSS
jgi:hypothetical protein